ncbi:hypothetical protein QTJ16_001947 [Diplocarpon rosae]|uniref:Prenylcysteine lyase domain-containing protein n=1 Tax=Diplocarpon rosae TaxID=946125 RepID=A0AAD9T4Z7_9HELO|nr:hypothetical protein QTJ16_001947 [Diplocarpon rosae]PBP19213.1 prenylcysteine oxidoreductase [Diplocarpon rosae]
MYSGWILVPTLITTILSGQSLGFGCLPRSQHRVDCCPACQAEQAADANRADEPFVNAGRGSVNIAIIGAGAAGSSAAYHLQKFADEDRLEIDVTVFERSSYVGGRVTTVDVHGDPREPVELGAGQFFPSNEILMSSSEELDLRTRGLEKLDKDVTGIWNGQKFVYTQNENSWRYWSLAKLLKKYGRSPHKAATLARNVMSHFAMLYKSPAFPFLSLSDISRVLDITPATFATAEDLLKDHKIKDSFATDFIQAATRVNSGMNLDSIHALQAMYSMIPEEPLQIEGGNWQLFDRMLSASNARVFVNKTVTTITRSEAPFTEFIITSSYKNPANEEILETAGPFDAVILATPMQYANIHIGPGLLLRPPEEIAYATLHVTLFTSSKTMSPAFFGLGPKDKVPTTVLTTLPPGERIVDMKNSVGSPGFFGIAMIREVINPETSAKEYLYRIFTPKKVTTEFLSDLFATELPEDLTSVSASSGHAITWYHAKEWQAYPYATPRTDFYPAVIGNHFFYGSAIESMLSSMETSAFMGKNIARLIVDGWRKLFVNTQGSANGDNDGDNNGHNDGDNDGDNESDNDDDNESDNDDYNESDNDSDNDSDEQVDVHVDPLSVTSPQPAGTT